MIMTTHPDKIMHAPKLLLCEWKTSPVRVSSRNFIFSWEEAHGSQATARGGCKMRLCIEGPERCSEQLELHEAHVPRANITVR